MNLNITIADDVRQDVACCVKDWFNEVGEWSQARYPKVNLETGTVISVETHETFSGVAYQPQKRPFVIRIPTCAISLIGRLTSCTSITSSQRGVITLAMRSA